MAADWVGREDHPLRKLVVDLEDEKRSGNGVPLEAPDHGTWHGNWSLPGRDVLELINEGIAVFENKT